MNKLNSIIYQSKCLDGEIRTGIEFVKYVNSKLLNITAPKIEWADENMFETPTTFAATNGQNIILNTTKKEQLMDLSTPVLWIVLSHELRHIWQATNGLISTTYTRQEKSIEEYNNQDEEIDANAWAWAITSIFANSRPLLPQEIEQKVAHKAETIITIKQIREALKMSQIAFGKAFDIPTRTIENWESGTRIPKTYITQLLVYTIFVNP